MWQYAFVESTDGPSSRLRVVLVLDTLTDVRMIEGFSDLFDLRVLVPASLKQLTPNQPSRATPVHRVSANRLTFVFKGFWSLMRDRNKFDVIFAMDNLTAALAANLVKVFAGKPTVLVLGRPTVDYFKSRRSSGMPKWKYLVGLLVVRLLVRFNEAVASVNAPVTHHMVSQMKSKNILLVPWYGVDTSAFSRRWTKAQAREALGLPQERQIIFCRSRIAPEKDPETALAAIAQIRAEGRDVLTLYVGGEYEEFLRLAQRFGVDVFASGHVHPLDELPMYYCAADVSVQTSKTEGLALSTLEALACEVPVVATAVGGMLETIKPHETGLNAPVGDVGALASAISYMLDHPSEAEEMAARGRKMVLELYDSRLAFDGYRTAAITAFEGVGRPRVRS